jgi:hypothetical protein
MMQTQWPGLGTSLDFSALDSSLGGDDGYVGAARGLPRAQRPDGIGRPWWTFGTGAGNGNAADPLGGLFASASDSNGSIAGILTGLVTLLQQLVGSFLNQNTSRSQNPNQAQNHPCAANGSQQRYEDIDVSSTGDPHLAAAGTRDERTGGGAVEAHWDSMSSQDDLVHSTQIDGGYRVSTVVTQPGANGVTWNGSATVHANFDQDAVIMNHDGSFAIYDNGAEVRLGKGESAELSGGEMVSENQDGSLIVSAHSATGGTIATTLRANGAGVDVTTHAHEIAVGGEAIAHADPTAPARATHGAHGAHGAHGTHRPHEMHGARGHAHHDAAAPQTVPMMPPAP